MKLRQFVVLMGIVALVAVIYSPSSLGITATMGGAGDGGTGPLDTSGSGTSMFYSYLQTSGYHVELVNDSQLESALGGTASKSYFLLGADSALSTAEVTAVTDAYSGGHLSVLIAEGNSTNEALLNSLGLSTTGSPIVDPVSPFQDQQVFAVQMTLGSTTLPGLIDVASSLRITHGGLTPANGGSQLAPVAQTSDLSYDVQNSTVGARTVVAASGQSAARVVAISDSAPFTNFLFNYTQPGLSERDFVASMVSYVVPDKSTPILLDDSHYTGPAPPKFRLGIPVGPLVTYALEQDLSSLNSYYNSFPSSVSGFLSGFGVPISPGAATALVAALLLLSIYGAVTKWFASEKKGKDDQPVPSVERSIVAESRARTDFLQTSRSKGSYVATLAQLYDLLDSMVLGEFGAGLASVDERALATRVGPDAARRAKELFLRLWRIRGYAAGERRILFPPVFRWRALTLRTTQEAESFLNRLGMSITVEDFRPGQGPTAAEARA